MREDAFDLSCFLVVFIFISSVFSCSGDFTAHSSMIYSLSSPYFLQPTKKEGKEKSALAFLSSNQWPTLHNWPERKERQRLAGRKLHKLFIAERRKLCYSSDSLPVRSSFQRTWSLLLGTTSQARWSECRQHRMHTERPGHTELWRGLLRHLIALPLEKTKEEVKICGKNERKKKEGGLNLRSTIDVKKWKSKSYRSTSMGLEPTISSSGGWRLIH